MAREKEEEEESKERKKQERKAREKEATYQVCMLLFLVVYVLISFKNQTLQAYGVKE